MSTFHRRLCVISVALFLAAGFSGCAPRLDERYGRSKGESLNGTGVFAGLVRTRGHEVRTALRLTDELSEWANVIVRLAPFPGTPHVEEADWYNAWLSSDPENRLIYIPRDYDATGDYWTLALSQLPPNAPARLRERIEEAKAETQIQAPLGGGIGTPPKTANVSEWFEVETGKPSFVSQKLGGPWADELDPAKVSISQHAVLKLDPKRPGRDTLLSGDDKPIAVEWNRPNGGKILVIGNASFLLNATIANKARRPLTERVVHWIGKSTYFDPFRKNVAFVEGSFVTSTGSAEPSVFHLLQVPPFGWIGAQILVLALIACLAKAPMLGRPKLAEPSGADRPVAHPEALGALLFRTRQAGEARTILEAYRKWRGNPPASPGSGKRVT